MKNMKVSVKLLVSFIIVIVLTAIVGVVGIFGMQQITAGSTELYYDQLQPIVDMGYASEYFQRIRVQLRNVVINTGDTVAVNNFAAEVDDRLEQFTHYFEAFREFLHSPEALRLASEIDDALHGTFMPGVYRAIDAALAGQETSYMMAILGETTAAGDTVANNLSEILSVRLTQSAELEASNEQLSSMMLIVIIAVLVLAVVIALALAIYISKLISNPLIMLTGFMKKAATTGDIMLSSEEETLVGKYAPNKDELGQCIAATSEFVRELNGEMDLLEKVAGGDLTISPKALSERDRVGNSLVKVVDNLNDMFAETNNASGQVSAGSKQISDGAQTLAQGSTEQASSVQQLSSSISEIAQKTKENAEMADRAAVLATDIKGTAEKGSGQMDEMMTAVRDINESSQNISKVIKSIDDIAFQTNILALNAAVEAARAGQHGKGFAVVAEEVRNLAAKSAEAAKDTESLIADSITKAELGSKIADNTAESLKEIVSGIDESTRLVGDIARSSEEQSDGIEQINKGVEQVAQVVQQNSATAEQSAAASEQMSGQSMMLEELISRFKLRNASGIGMKSLPTTNSSYTTSAVSSDFGDTMRNIENTTDDSFGKY